MPISIPRSVREAWGDQATEDFAGWFHQAVQEITVSPDEYRHLQSRLAR